MCWDYWCVYWNTSIWEIWNASEKMQRRWNCGMRLNFLILINKGRLLSGTVYVLYLFNWLFCHGTFLHSIGFCKYENLMIAQCGMIHSAYNMCNVWSLACNRYIDASDYELQKFVKDWKSFWNITYSFARKLACVWRYLRNNTYYFSFLSVIL